MRGATGTTVDLTLHVSSPYEASPLLAYLEARAIVGVEQVDRSRYSRVVRMAGESRLLVVDFSRAAADSTITVSCAPGDGLTEEAVRQVVMALTDSAAPVTVIEQRLAQDPLLKPLVRRNSGSRIPGTTDPFELAVRAVLGQQISVAAASTLAGRVAARWGWRLTEGEPGLELAFPDPTRLVDAPLETAGVSRGRAEAIRELSTAVIDGRIELRSGQDHDQAVERLLSIKGIGPWTAAYIALRGLGNHDAVPTGDLGLRQALSANGETWTAHDVAERAESWRPWRGYGAVHLWNTFLAI